MSESAAMRSLGGQTWHLLGTAPGRYAGPAELPDNAAWLATPGLGTIAAMLGGAGRDWSEAAQVGEPGRVPGQSLGNPLDAADWWLRFQWQGDATQARPDAAGTLLHLDGLATIAQVWLNGTPVAESRNMFLAQHLWVTEHLVPQGNTLVICLRSLDAALQARRGRPRWRAPMIEHQQLRWWRTTVLGRTPGWSSPAAAVGAWRDIRLETVAPGWRLGATQLRAQLDGRDGVLDVEVPLQWLGPLPAVSSPHAWRAAAEPTLTLLVQRAGVAPASAVVHQLHLLRAPNEDRWSARLRLSQVDRWWPHTHGEPALYTVQLRLELPGEPHLHDLGRVGFRSMQIETGGGDFRVEVNEEEIFCRGACWTPLDAVGLRATAADYRQAVGQLRAAGMNMVRVAGTMVYEPQAFFDACDEAGVLVWQEFMLANMDYPEDDPAWLASVEQEARQQLQLWQGHACLAVVCGNSEVEQQAAMWGAARALWEPALFHEHLPAWVAEVLPDTPYWPSSAHGGAYPHAVDSGTTSSYAVGAYLRDLDDARRQAPVFATECLAFANVPTTATLEHMPSGTSLRVTHPGWKQRSPRDLGAGWDFDDVRDHYLERLFSVDARMLRYSQHERYLMLARVASGEVMAAAMAEWRRPGSRCRGALIWFLRDLWAGAGWGLLDNQGLPKPCWHIVRRVLQPQAVLFSDEGHSGLVAHVINEGPRPLQARLVIDVWRVRQRLEQVEADLELPAHGQSSLPVAGLLDHFCDLTYAFRFGARQHDAVRARLLSAEGQELARHWYLPQGLQHAVQEGEGLSAMAQPQADGTVQVTIEAAHLLLSVHFEVPGWLPDDEYFHLAPQEQRTVTLRPLPPPAARPRVWRGTVQAVNLAQPVVIKSVS